MFSAVSRHIESVVSMNDLKKETLVYWNQFLADNPNLESSQPLKINAWSFGNSPQVADELVSLVLEGEKTATCSLLRVYRDSDEKVPTVGSYSIILDGAGLPKCVVLLTDTFIRRFNEIDETHAFEEGEGDRSLEFWKKVHRDFFSQYKDFQEDEYLLCERFKVVSKY